MWIKSHSCEYQDVKKEAIWYRWTDINNWPIWHDDLDYCKMKGDFAVGNYFILKPKRAFPVKITITDIEHGNKFTDCTYFFGAKMYNTHVVEENQNGLRLTNTIVVVGPLRCLWIKLVAQHVAESVPYEMDALVNLSRGSND